MDGVHQIQGRVRRRVHAKRARVGRFDKEVKAKRREANAKGKGKGKGKVKQIQKGKGTCSKREPIEIDSESDSEEEGNGNVKMEVWAGLDDNYQGMPGDLPRFSTVRTRRAARLVKQPRTS